MFLSVDAGITPEDMLNDCAWLDEETERLKSFVSLLVELASSRAWSQSQFVNCAPNNFACVLHRDREIAQQFFNHHKSIWQAVLLAEQCLVHKKLKANVAAIVQERLNDVAWNRLQLARETYVFCCQKQFNADSLEVQETAAELFGVPWNTKYDLEDCFAHLASVNRTHSQATPMNRLLSLQCQYICMA